MTVKKKSLFDHVNQIKLLHQYLKLLDLSDWEAEKNS